VPAQNMRMSRQWKLPMRIADVFTRTVVHVPPEMSVVDAARAMREHHVGALIITDSSNGGGVPIGIVTDRDIAIEVVAAGVDPATLTVRDIMTREPVTCGADEELHDLIRTMNQTGVRRIPVVSPEGALAGIVTADDVIGALSWHLRELTRALTHGQALEMQRRV
jgi:CBS domain-containing protein